MAAARYWRVIGVATRSGGDLELSELQLHGAGGRVDVGAAMFASHSPAVGSLALLGDGSFMADCRFDAAAVRSAGFYIQWDLGASGAAEAVGVAIGAGASEATWVDVLTLQRLDGVAWVTVSTMGRFPYPGAHALLPVQAPSYDAQILSQSPLLYWRLGESAGAVAADAAGYGNVGEYTVDAAGLSVPGIVAGDGAISLAGANAQVGVTRASNPLVNSSAWTIFISAKPTGVPPVTGVGVLWKLGGTFGPEVDVLDVGGGRFRLRVMSSGAALLFTSTSSWAYDTAILVVLRHGGGVVRLNVNGQNEGQVSHTYPADSSRITVGYASFGGTDYYPMLGVLDEFSMHQLLVSDGSVAAIYSTWSVPSAGYLPLAVRLREFVCLVAASATVPSHAASKVAHRLVACDVEYGGAGRIWGVTKIKGAPGAPDAPVKSRVVLLHQRSKLPVREVWSDPITGAFAFEGIDTTQQFLTLAEDAAGNFRPVAASRLVPEVAP